MRHQVWRELGYARNGLFSEAVSRTIRERAQLRHRVGAGMMRRGELAEQRAADYLVRCGLRLVARNYRCRYGEIDLIAQHGEVLVFVEVRLRSRGDFGGAAASIDLHKQRKLILTAQHYLSQLPRLPACRFDAVLMQGSGEGVEWVKDAFRAW